METLTPVCFMHNAVNNEYIREDWWIVFLLKKEQNMHANFMCALRAELITLPRTHRYRAQLADFRTCLGVPTCGVPEHAHLVATVPRGRSRIRCTRVLRARTAMSLALARQCVRVFVPQVSGAAVARSLRRVSCVPAAILETFRAPRQPHAQASVARGTTAPPAARPARRHRAHHLLLSSVPRQHLPPCRCPPGTIRRQLAACWHRTHFRASRAHTASAAYSWNARLVGTGGDLESLLKIARRCARLATIALRAAPWETPRCAATAQCTALTVP